MPRTLQDPSLDAQETKALEDVQRYGLHVVHVLPQGDTPGWSYSIGLWHSCRHPELVVFGLGAEVAQRLLNRAASEIRAGRSFEAPKEYAGLLDGAECAIRPVAPVWYYPFFGWARWFYGDEEFPVLQCLWPDYEKHYPWEESFNQDWSWLQPLLWHTGPGAARTSELLDGMGLELNTDAAS